MSWKKWMKIYTIKKPSDVFTFFLEKKTHDDSLLGQRSTQTLDTDFPSSNAGAFRFAARRLASQFRATALISPTLQTASLPRRAQLKWVTRRSRKKVENKLSEIGEEDPPHVVVVDIFHNL